ncbi:hypothetical protein PCL_05969 [Purpureocillium lilacinum]|uniref:Uncharacterized protein n=1 Tax=Purpureocillium lilacinum TaxID=33203 RepID=A0A2U3ELC5_PURLI|nr:hypothetical protein PCL_05969 [Purpureocillium lilacinum]
MAALGPPLPPRNPHPFAQLRPRAAAAHVAVPAGRRRLSLVLGSLWLAGCGFQAVSGGRGVLRGGGTMEIWGWEGRRQKGTAHGQLGWSLGGEGAYKPKPHCAGTRPAPWAVAIVDDRCPLGPALRLANNPRAAVEIATSTGRLALAAGLPMGMSGGNQGAAVVVATANGRSGYELRN